MNIIILAVVCLLLFCLIFIYKYIKIKKQLQKFSYYINKYKDPDYNEPVKVDSFDRDLVKLAVLLNEHIEIQKKLREENITYRKELSNTISGISHDFRTPLTSSLGYLQMIEKSNEFTPKNKQYLQIAIEKNKYLKQLSDDFFEISKLRCDTEQPHTEKINMSNMLSEYILQQYEWISRRNITTEFNIKDDIIINADRHNIERIISNLFSNAEKYSEKYFSVNMTEKENAIILTVSNDISDTEEIDTKRVFEPFYRSNSRSKEGSGLGLYVAKCICENINFSISADIKNNIFTVKVIYAKVRGTPQSPGQFR